MSQQLYNLVHSMNKSEKKHFKMYIYSLGSKTKLSKLFDIVNKQKDYDYSDCDIQTRQEFVDAFRDTLLMLSDYKVMLTMHHPFYTTGSHGGYFPFTTYMMPMTGLKPRLLIPLPATGFISNLMRSRLSEQDTKSSPYASYRSTLIPYIEQHGNILVAAGHEHTLQHHVINGINYIVSGSGSKRGPLTTESYTKFAYGNFGYAIVDYFKDDSVWIRFFANDEEDKNFIEVYRSKLL